MASADLVSEDQLKRLLARTREAAEARDSALRRLDDNLATGNEDVERAQEYLTDTFRTQLANASEQAAAVASQVQAASRGAEASHRKVTAMDERLKHVRAALDVVRAVVKQRASVSKVTTAVETGDYETAVDLVVQYDAVSKILQNFPAERLSAVERRRRQANEDGAASADHSDDGASSQTGSSANPTSSLSFGEESASNLPADETIQRARSQLRSTLIAELDAACQAKLEPSVQRFATMLARLGCVEDGCKRFTDFVVAAVSADLRHFVDEALQDVQIGKTTHLVACVSVLDRIAAAMERHKPFMDETFAGHSDALILALHSEATHFGVDVLQDFLSTRRGVVGKAGSGGNKRSAAHERTQSGQPGASNKSANAKRGVDPRSLDQTLEDISHLLTCCHQYLAFVVNCVTGHLDAKADKHKIHELRSRIQNSPLLKEVGGLMNIYLPVQSEYFETAFDVAVQQCDEALAEHLQPLRAALEASSSGGGFTESIMGMWGGRAAASSPSTTGAAAIGPELQPGAPKFEALLDEANVTLVDDLFHVLLIAIRRAAGTRDITIASATVNAVNAVLVENLLPELKARLHEDTAGGAELTPIAAAVRKRLRARWLRVAHNAAEYTAKLGLDCEQAAAANFGGAELFRLAEQKHDFTTTAQQLREAVEEWTRTVGDEIARDVVNACVGPFDAAPHVLQSEQAYVNAGLGDTWVAACRPVLESELHHLQFPFPEALRDTIVGHVTDAVVAWLAAAVPKKQYDAFGALQLDREVRDLRNFVSSLADTPLRDRFATVQAMAAVLMSETAAEATQEARGKVDDVQALLRCRVDL